MQMSLTVEERLDRIEQLLRGQKNVLNFSEACDFTGISPSYMYKLTHSARIPHYKPHGKNVYFLREELEQWLLQNHSGCCRIPCGPPNRRIAKRPSLSFATGVRDNGTHRSDRSQAHRGGRIIYP